MRIAIVTLPFVVNYGGVLQCYALQTALERLGHGVCVLQRKVPASIRARLMVKSLESTSKLSSVSIFAFAIFVNGKQ